ncbi:riboflavin kinase [Patescibacteria group bacterium]|nr:riboflavin kinase [Patescibacteria group bacterium]MBU1016010.1 riboflavin kinase [Patescibacteria group bacterium]MBU1684635.1 riboflavin kinase [Patescibacteria group bacterium]MBU1939075.1 riboflavin kinase [Patescibacteria group bacterium]
MWIRRKVKSGQQFGRQLGHPTLNFNVGVFGSKYKPGVYTCEVRIHDTSYKGALFFGHKSTTRKMVLEVYVLNYFGNLYGQYVYFKPLKWLRAPKKFSSSELLKKQIQKDVASIV